MRRFIVSLFATLTTLFALTPPPARAGDAPLVTEFGPGGLRSLKYGATELLAGGETVVWPVKLAGPDEKPQDADRADAVTSENGGRSVLHTCAWGTVRVTFQPTGARLNIKVRAENKGTKPVAQLAVKLLEIRFPQKPKGRTWETGYGLKGDNRDDVTVIGADYGDATLVACNDDPGSPVQFGFGDPAGPKKDAYRLELNTLLTNVAKWDTVIEPGQSVEWNFSLRFGPAGSIGADLAKDVYARLAAKHPFRVNWPDRRPIGMLILCTKGGMPKTTNPRGYLADPKIDVTTDDGRAKFKARMLADADRIIKVLRAVDAQGVIVWDVEGEEFPQPTTYVGDPLLLKELAPEMDAIADEYFAKFTAAGLTTGVCARPSDFVKIDDPAAKIPYRHRNMGYDVAELVSRKIEYAKKRWGCKLFYMDSDVIWAYDREKKPANMLVTADLFKAVLERDPDVLIIPEFSKPASCAYVATYYEVRDQPWANKTSTPDTVLRIYPQAFSVLNTADAKFDQKHDALAASSRRGDVMLFRGWWGEPNNAKVKAIYDEGHAPQPAGK